MSQFSSLSRRGNYAYAGKVAANDALNAFIAQKKRSPDFGKFISDAEKIKATERINATKRTQETFDAISNIEATSKINKIKFDADQNLKKSQRFAGVLGAAGQLVSTGANKLYDAKNRDTDVDNTFLTYYDNQIEKVKGGIKADQTLQDDLQATLDSLSKPPSTAKETNSSSITQTTPISFNNKSSQNFKFTPVQSKGLAAIRRVESGPYGYNAYNLGGKTEFDPIGSGSAADGKRYGKPLTEMTINEIDALGQSGKIHATGAYQFTHNTGSFREAVKFAGLSGDDLFTPENQDLMALTFGQKYGWQRWSGLKRDPEARDEAIAGFRQ